VLTVEGFDALVADDPRAASELHRAIAASLAGRLRQATRTISALDQRH
jgi:hypothetical protein